MKKHVVVTLVVAMLLSVCGVCVAAGNDLSARNLETRVIQLEADKQVNDARWEKDKELKEIVKQQIQNSSQTISAVGTIANIVTGIIGVFALIISIIGFFGFKSFNEIRKNLKEEYDDIVTKRKDVDASLKKIIDRQKEIEGLFHKSKGAYANIKENALIITKMMSVNQQTTLGNITLEKKTTWEKLFQIYKEQDYKKVVAIAETVQKNDKEYADVCTIWGFSLLQLELPNEAIEKVKIAINIQPDNDFAHSALGLIYQQIGRIADAINEYSKSIKYDPENAVAYFCRASAYALKDDERAFDDLKMAIKIDGTYKEEAKTESNFDSIRKDERYLKLVQG